MTSGDSPIGISLSRQILDHGDYVVSGISQTEFENDNERGKNFKHFLAQVGRGNTWKERLKVIALDIRCAAPAIAGFNMQEAPVTDQIYNAET